MIVLDGYFNYFPDRGECSSFFEKNAEEKDFSGTMMCGRVRRRDMNIVNHRVSDYMAHNPDCRTCEYRTECCGGCRAVALQGGSTDYLGKDPVACEYFRGRLEREKGCCA